MTSRNGEGFTSLENHLSSLILTQYNLCWKSPELSRSLFQQCLCLLEIGGVKALGEP
jgi:hypothetical protein